MKHGFWVLFLAVSMSACGGGGGSSSAMDAEPSPAPTNSPSPTPSPSPAPAPALTPVADATLFEDAEGDVASGKGGALFAGATISAGVRRLLLRFDSAELPSQAPTAAELRIQATRVRNNGAKRFTLHRVLESWSEGNSDAGEGAAGQGTAAQPGDATWIHREFDTLTWSMAGGVFVATPSGEATIGGPEEVVFESLNQGMEQDVAAWQANPAENFGWIIIGDETSSGDAVRFAGRDHSQAELHPQLILTVP